MIITGNDGVPQRDSLSKNIDKHDNKMTTPIQTAHDKRMNVLTTPTHTRTFELTPT
eukprot:m.427162 g.427162  ORF g.427162 m.427162 type:complete len:56 (-) comp16864_c3_seq9:3999-4166(-)